MAKRAKLTSKQLSPALSNFTAKKPQEETQEKKPENVPEVQEKEKLISLTLRLNEDAWLQLKYLAVDQRRPAHALLVEAVNDLYKKYGKEPIA